MASKGLPDFKKQVEGAAQEAVDVAGTAAQQVVDQATEAGQKAMEQVVKTTQETIDKTANQATESFSGFGKKFGLMK
ncbi:adipogenesis regulatory factor [Erinaceus europaeus]|uniref:Adipogenesis regulatory factor n=1 Tax=Erinaceus europaeus TaxID=9365 RepID=A0A1S3A6V1_ERIEU|nr:adipogenesis regulatory factor [Erinaceus europaeus]